MVGGGGIGILNVAPSKQIWGEEGGRYASKCSVSLVLANRAMANAYN